MTDDTKAREILADAYDHYFPINGWGDDIREGNCPTDEAKAGLRAVAASLQSRALGGVPTDAEIEAVLDAEEEKRKFEQSNWAVTEGALYATVRHFASPTRAETVEECARVADMFEAGGRQDRRFGFRDTDRAEGEGAMVTARSIATAIRALAPNHTEGEKT